MLNLTPFARPYFARRIRTLRFASKNRTSLHNVQERELRSLLSKAVATEQGRNYGYENLLSAENLYHQFAENIPVVEYEDIRSQVMRMVNGEKNILWPGKTTRFAQSSGTSGGKSKYIPITDEGLRRNHYGGASDAVAMYLANYSKSRLFGGKSFILGGSFATEIGTLPPGVHVGDLSATLINEINPLVNLLFRVPDKTTALMENWEKKLPLLVEQAMKQNITNISGVPSWFMIVIEKIIEQSGARTIHDVWPNLEVFFHGGISFEPYREQYSKLTDPSRMRFLETYNASEGFFAAQDLREHGKGMLLLNDRGVFYEFRDSFGNVLPAWEVKEGETYELIITTVNGLWRYAIGDTVRIESVEPLRISIAGRTSSFINAFGEELMVHNAERAISKACAENSCQVNDYTVAPVYALADGTRGRHEWLIEWKTPPKDVEKFAASLDEALRQCNSDYDAKRSGGIFMDSPLITTARNGLFNRWLAATGKLGGQRKVPRLSNSRKIIDQLKAYNS